MRGLVLIGNVYLEGVDYKILVVCSFFSSTLALSSKDFSFTRLIDCKRLDKRLMVYERKRKGYPLVESEEKIGDAGATNESVIAPAKGKCYPIES